MHVEEPSRLEMVASVSDILEKIGKQGASEIMAVSVDADGMYYLHISHGTDRKSAVMYLLELIHEMLHHEMPGDEDE